MNKKTIIICLAAILVIASLLRFAGLKERGIILVDEGDFLCGGRTVVAALNFLFNKTFFPETIKSSFTDYISVNGGGYASAVKPGYYLLVAISFLIGGVHDYSMLYFSAILGLMIVILSFLIARLLYNLKVAFYSAILVSFSPYLVNYSRSALSVCATTFFLYLGVYLLFKYFKNIEYKKSNKLQLIFSGMAFGYAYTCHYNLIATMAIIFVVFTFFTFNPSSATELRRAREGALVFKPRGSTKSGLKDIAFLIIGFLVPVIFFEIPYIIVKHLTKGMLGATTGQPYMIKTYFEQLAFIYTKTFFYERPQASVFSYIDLMLKTEGFLVLILFFFGCIFMLCEKFKKDRLCNFLLFCLGPCMLLFFSLLGEKAPRAILSVMPAFYIITALFLSKLDVWIEAIVKNKYISYAFLILPVWLGIIIFQSMVSFEYIKFKSPYPHAINYIKKQGDYKHFSSNPPVSIFYAGLKNTNPYWDIKLKDARNLYKTQNYRFLILDMGEEGSSYRNGLVDLALKSNAKPVFKETYNPLPFVLEDLYFYKYKEREFSIIYYKYKNIKKEDYPAIRVFDLKDIIG